MGLREIVVGAILIAVYEAASRAGVKQVIFASTTNRFYDLKHARDVLGFVPQDSDTSAS